MIRLNDIGSLRDAEEVVGRELYIEGEWEDDDMDDFTGWTLLDRDHVVGTITGLEPIPGNPCLQVGDVLIPLHEDFVVSIDEEHRELVLDLPEGLY